MTIIDKQTEIINTENKFLNPIWLWSQNNTRYTSIWGQNDSLVLKTLKVYDNHRQRDRDYEQSSDITYKLENKIGDIF